LILSAGYPLRPIASGQPHLVLNLGKMRRHSWTPKVGLDEGMRKAVEYGGQRIKRLSMAIRSPQVTPQVM
jgi:hypothetical protein